MPDQPRGSRPEYGWVCSRSYVLGRCGTKGNDDGIEGDCVGEVECDGMDDLKRDSKDGDRDLEDNGEDDDIEGGGEESEDDDQKCTVVIYSRAKAKGIIKKAVVVDGHWQMASTTEPLLSQTMVESDTFEPNLRPIAILTSYLCLAFALTVLILRTLYEISAFPRPSQEPHTLNRKRRLHIQVTGALTLASLAVTWFYMLKFFALSYRTWARERGISDAFRENSAQLYLGQWLKETSLFRDAWETVIEECKRFWWSQQVFLITTIWSVYLGIEGYRYNIRHLWAFMLLGQIVAISFAMNLFFFAILFGRARSENLKDTLPPNSKYEGFQKADLNPSDGHSNSDFLHQTRRKLSVSSASSWTSYHILFYIPLFVNFIAIAIIPYVSNTSVFLPTLAMPHVLLFLPLYIPTIVPLSRDLFQPSADAARRQFLGIYRFVFFIAICLHGKATVVVLLDATPDRHSVQDDVPFERANHSPRLKIARIAITNLLGSLNDHPAVSSVGWDVMMCYLSVTMWVVAQRPAILRDLWLGIFSSDENTDVMLSASKKKIAKHDLSVKND